MKRILIILLLFPIIIKASSCDYKTLDNHTKLSNNIDYTVSYDKNTDKYSINFYNVYKGLYLTYGSKIYIGNSENEVTINNIDSGTYMNISVNSDLENCESFIKNIYVNVGYYNEFYDSAECAEYKNILTVCTDKYLPYKVSKSNFESIIKNYKSAYTEETEKKEEEKIEEVSFIESIQSFLIEWGILLLAIIFSGLLTSILFRNVFRKIKHGI